MERIMTGHRLHLGSVAVWPRLVRGGITLVTLAVGLSVMTGGSPAIAAPLPSGPTAGAIEHFAIVPSASSVTYRVGETFFEENRFNVAVGTTQSIQGDIFVDRANPTRSRVGPITIDISTFRSNSARRDRAIRDRWLESSRYPTAQFTPTAVHGLPALYRDGQDVPVQVLGNLRVRAVTRPVTFTGTVKLAGNMLTGTVQTAILMTDFGFDPPAILGMLKAENQVRLELQFTAKRAA